MMWVCQHHLESSAGPSLGSLLEALPYICLRSSGLFSKQVVSCCHLCTQAELEVAGELFKVASVQVPHPHPHAAGSTDLGEACSSGMQGSLLKKVWLTAYV